MAQPISDQHRALGDALRALRHERSLTLEQLGDLVEPHGMNPRYISACERGEVNISFANLLRLSGALRVPLSEVVARFEAPAR